MGLLDWFRRRGASEPGAPDVDFGGADEPEEYRGHGAGVPAGSASEGPPVGVSDPGSLSGEDADEVIAADEGEEPGTPRPEAPAG
jgi:hypothetical protein